LTLQNAPAWLALVDAGDGTGIFTGTPDAAGEVSFTVVAADETGLRDERPVQLAIEAADSVFTWSYPPDIVLPAAASAAASDDGVIVTGHPATRVNNYPDAGTVLIRQRDPATGAVESIGTLIPPEPSSRGRFGSAVAISGQYLYVGASGTGINGSVFVYKRSS